MTNNLPQTLPDFLAYAAVQSFQFDVLEQDGLPLPSLTVQLVRVLGQAINPLYSYLQPTITLSENNTRLTVSFTAQQSEMLLPLAKDGAGVLLLRYRQAGRVVLIQEIKFTTSGLTSTDTPYLITTAPPTPIGSVRYANGALERWTGTAWVVVPISTTPTPTPNTFGNLIFGNIIFS